MGNLVQTVEQDVLFHVLAEDRFRFLWLHDALTNQKDKRIRSYDLNLLADHDAYPVDINGSPRSSGLMYPDLVRPTGEGGYGWKQIRIEETSSTAQPRLGPVSYCVVRYRVGVDIP